MIENDDWDLIDSTSDSKWLAELNAELSNTHPLYQKAVKSIARCYPQDDVLYQLENGEYAIVHLTYSHTNVDGWPRFILFENLNDAERYIAGAEY